MGGLPAHAGPAAAGSAGSPTDSARWSALLAEGQAAEDRLDPEAALRAYLRASAERPRDVAVLLKVAKEYSDSTLVCGDPEANRRSIARALEYSRRAEELDPNNAVALLSIAVCYGKLGLYGGVREKLACAREVKAYAERAAAADPGYAYAHHVLGQWEYEVASLGATKRFLIDLIGGGLPPASTHEAVAHLQKAVDLEPTVMAHRLALGCACAADGDKDRARKLFREVLSMPRREIYDADCQRQAERELKAL